MAEVDGLRFIAIFSVILFHVYYNVAFAHEAVLAASPFSFMIWPVTHGFRGVQLFFVISGFILGLPFAAHYLTRGPAVKVGQFYLRRLTRLEPPYILALLLIYGAAAVMHNVHTREPGFSSGLPLRLVYAYLFVRGVPPTLDGVTWTLEIEVQFYLLAPLLAQVFKLATIPRRLTLIAAICGAPLLAWVVPRSDVTLLGFIHFFLAGFLLADIHCTGAGAGRLPARFFDLLGIGCLLVTLLVPERPVLKPLEPSRHFYGGPRFRCSAACAIRFTCCTIRSSHSSRPRSLPAACRCHRLFCVWPWQGCPSRWARGWHITS
jgi:peptidoglycan/LPS O-acetylase OafA/YrhL